MEGFIIFGVAAFVCVMYLFGELNKLKRKVNHMKGRRRTEKGEQEEMSRLLKELEGKWCVVESDDLDVEKVQICDVDEEWVRVKYTEKVSKGETEKQVLIRTESIDCIEILSDSMEGGSSF